jgi:hypothetical protein
LHLEYGQVVRHVISIFCQALPPSRLPMSPCAFAPDLYIFIWIHANLSKLRSAWVRGFEIGISVDGQVWWEVETLYKSWLMCYRSAYLGTTTQIMRKSCTTYSITRHLAEKSRGGTKPIAIMQWTCMLVNVIFCNCWKQIYPATKHHVFHEYFIHVAQWRIEVAKKSLLVFESQISRMVFNSINEHYFLQSLREPQNKWFSGHWLFPSKIDHVWVTYIFNCRQLKTIGSL